MLSGKVAVVTGATRGIGKGIALELGAAGATVYVTGRTLEPNAGPLRGSLPETAAEVTDAGGIAVAVQCDHGRDEDVQALFRRVRDEHGSLDLLVNNVFNAPQFDERMGTKFWKQPLSAWDEVIHIGLRSHYVASYYAAPLMLDRGGLIVNISSAGAQMYSLSVAYGVGKAGLDRMTKDMAIELRKSNVAVVSVWPMVTRTEHVEAMVERSDPKLRYTGTTDYSEMESQRFTGRAVVALATDPGVMGRSGTAASAAQLARDYGFTDVDGRQPPVFEVRADARS
jgi:NAD(P)-dependent dehydrogenase (short-subunit alcohol dehydrogenase family)